MYSRRAERAVGKLNDVTVMSSPQFPSLTEASSVIRVAIVSEPETTVLADSLEALLDRAKGFSFSRFEYRVESDLKPRPAGLANPDVVVATLGMTAHDLGVEIGRKIFHGLDSVGFELRQWERRSPSVRFREPARECNSSRFLRSVCKSKADANRRYHL